MTKRETNPRLKVLFIEELERVMGGNNEEILPDITSKPTDNEGDQGGTLGGGLLGQGTET